jgi:hypothetical protein
MPKQNDHAQPTGGINARDWLDVTCDEDQATAEKLLNDLRNRDVLFYPACEYNWNPIKKLHFACDTFVYVQATPFNRADRGTLLSSLQELARGPEWSLCPLLATGFLGEYTDDLGGARPRRGEAANPFPTWGELFKIGIGPRRGDGVWLLYLWCDPAAAYRKLFTAQQTAPRFMFLHRPAAMPEVGWARYLKANGALARAVRENKHERLPCLLRDVGEHGLL